jgi:hypothetical protein
VWLNWYTKENVRNSGVLATKKEGKSKMKKIILISTFLFAFSMYPALANDIYIEQVGDSLDLDIVQDGQDNVIGTSTTAAVLEGDSMTFSITQTGNYNTIAATIKGASYTGTWDITGDSNTIDMLCDSTGAVDCDSVRVDITVGGTNISDSNDFKIYVGETADAENLIASFTVDGDGNVFDVDVDGTSANLTVTVDNTASLASSPGSNTGGSLTAATGTTGNVIDIDIDGNGDTNGHTINLDITGGGSSYSITQSGIQDNTVDATFDGDNQDVNITQSD